MTLRDIIARLDKCEALAGSPVYCEDCDDYVENEQDECSEAIERLRLDIERYLLLTEGRI